MIWIQRMWMPHLTHIPRLCTPQMKNSFHVLFWISKTIIVLFSDQQLLFPHRIAQQNYFFSGNSQRFYFRCGWNCISIQHLDQIAPEKWLWFVFDSNASDDAVTQHVDHIRIHPKTQGHTTLVKNVYANSGSYVQYILFFFAHRVLHVSDLRVF